MKFSIKKETLLHSLNSVSKALSSKNIIPILSGIKFNLTELYKVCPLIGIDKKSIERGLQR